jgi:hypothetical protein
MTAALDGLAGQLRSHVTSYGEPGNPVAGFVRAARLAMAVSIPAFPGKS